MFVTIDKELYIQRMYYADANIVLCLIVVGREREDDRGTKHEHNLYLR